MKKHINAIITSCGVTLGVGLLLGLLQMFIQNWIPSENWSLLISFIIYFTFLTYLSQLIDKDNSAKDNRNKIASAMMRSKSPEQIKTEQIEKIQNIKPKWKGYYEFTAYELEQHYQSLVKDNCCGNKLSYADYLKKNRFLELIPKYIVTENGMLDITNRIDLESATWMGNVTGNEVLRIKINVKEEEDGK